MIIWYVVLLIGCLNVFFTDFLELLFVIPFYISVMVFEKYINFITFGLFVLISIHNAGVRSVVATLSSQVDGYGFDSSPGSCNFSSVALDVEVFLGSDLEIGLCFFGDR